MGYDGVVFFEAKTGLIPYYVEAFGAMQIGGSQRMILDGKAARELYEQYYRDA